MGMHIGAKIKSMVAKRGISVSEFGRRINMSRENVYSIFKRKSIDTTLLSTICKVLEYDFFLHYTKLFPENQKLKDEVSSLKAMVKLLQGRKK